MFDKKNIRAGKHFWKTVFSMMILVILFLVWFFVIGISTNRPGSEFNKGHNAVWIGHKWVGESKSATEIRDLVRTLEDNQIDTVFVHAGPLKSDGSIDPDTYRYSIDFIDTAKNLSPYIKYQAWVGQLRGKLDLDDPIVRRNIVNQSMIFTEMVGFDGIHFDIEPVWDEDEAFILLLDEVRAALTEDIVISVALAEFIPKSVIWFAEGIVDFELYNSETSYRNVAAHADQVVLMAYDTSIKKGRLYRWLVKEQAIWVTGMLSDAEVFVGIPAYDYFDEDGDVTWFDPSVENIENGVRGVISGLNNVRSNDGNFAGIAIYPYWEIDEVEWGVWKKLWLSEPLKNTKWQ